MPHMQAKVAHILSCSLGCRFSQTSEYTALHLLPACREALEKDAVNEHECNTDGTPDIDLCTSCREHTSWCSECTLSSCCGSAPFNHD